MPSNLQEFRHTDKLAAIALAEQNSQNDRQRKSITVQHFNNAGIADSPAELVTTQVGHSPVSMQAINGGLYVASENDPEALMSTPNQQPQRNRNREFQSA
jgi:hypothetical protein